MGSLQSGLYACDTVRQRCGLLAATVRHSYMLAAQILAEVPRLQTEPSSEECSFPGTSSL